MALQPPSTLLMGAPGSGKTSASVTYALAGIETFTMFTEPNGPDVLIDAAKRVGAPLRLLHWCTVAPTTPGWSAITQMATTVKAMSYEDVAKIKQGVGKYEMQQFETMLRAIQNFKCDRTGEFFGDVTTWDSRRAFVFDGLTGLNMISMAQTIGFKPSAHQGEWGIAMNLEETIVHKLTSDRGCFFTLTAHMDRETDELSGRSILTPAALGRKIGPRLGRFFSEVVLARKQGDGKFYWATIDAQAELKNRDLPLSATIDPSYAPLVGAYRQRLAAISSPPPAAAAE